MLHARHPAAPSAVSVWYGVHHQLSFDAAQVNEKCDIFALGILLWECMTGTRPFMNMHAFQIMMHLQTNQTRGEDWLPFPKHTPPEFKRLERRCWHAENRFRISADEVCLPPCSSMPAVAFHHAMQRSLCPSEPLIPLVVFRCCMFPGAGTLQVCLMAVCHLY